MSAGRYQVGPQTFVILRCQVFDAEGEAASVAEVDGYVIGMGQLLPQVETALEGHFAGEHVQITLAEKDAYGRRDPTRIVEVDRSDFPENVAPGERFELENLEGGLLVVHVLDVQPDYVVLDMNHPLAGQEVSFQVEIQEVRPATQEEIEAAEACLTEDAEYVRADVPDVSASSLLRPRASR